MNGNVRRKFMMKCEDVFKSLEVFSFKDLQTFETILKVINKKNISIDQVLDCVITKKKEISASIKKNSRKIIRKCPNCKTELIYRSISEPKGKSNRRGYTWNWVCPNCDFDEYTYENISGVLKKYGVNIK
jgi:predicted RNA-binding Zn-ribbon protein involved in translation (DUF1610 family)